MTNLSPFRKHIISTFNHRFVRMLSVYSALIVFLLVTYSETHAQSGLNSQPSDAQLKSVFATHKKEFTQLRAMLDSETVDIGVSSDVLKAREKSLSQKERKLLRLMTAGGIDSITKSFPPFKDGKETVWFCSWRSYEKPFPALFERGFLFSTSANCHRLAVKEAEFTPADVPEDLAKERVLLVRLKEIAPCWFICSVRFGNVAPPREPSQN